MKVIKTEKRGRERRGEEREGGRGGQRERERRAVDKPVALRPVSPPSSKAWWEVLRMPEEVVA